jgi:hypothetical protein
MIDIVALVTNEPAAESLDLNRAYLLLRVMSRDPESRDVHRVADLIAAQGRPEPILRGLGEIIDQLVGFVDDSYELVRQEGGFGEGDEPVRDVLHVFQPAIVVRLSRTVDLEPATVPLMAGVLTAAASGLNGYRWRSHLGAWLPGEHPAWAFTAFYLCDLIGHIRGEPDFAYDLIGTAVASTDQR